MYSDGVTPSAHLITNSIGVPSWSLLFGPLTVALTCPFVKPPVSMLLPTPPDFQLTGSAYTSASDPFSFVYTPMSSGTSGLAAAGAAATAVGFAASDFFFVATSMEEITFSLTPAVLSAIKACTDVSKFVAAESIAAIVVDSSKPPFTICTTSSLVSGLFDWEKTAPAASSNTAASTKVNFARMDNPPLEKSSAIAEVQTSDIAVPWIECGSL